MSECAMQPESTVGHFLLPALLVRTPQPSDVAGLAALLVAEMGHGKPSQIKHAIEQSAAPINPLLGSGRISVSNTLGL